MPDRTGPGVFSHTFVLKTVQLEVDYFYVFTATPFRRTVRGARIFCAWLTPGVFCPPVPNTKWLCVCVCVRVWLYVHETVPNHSRMFRCFLVFVIFIHSHPVFLVSTGSPWPMDGRNSISNRKQTSLTAVAHSNTTRLDSCFDPSWENPVFIKQGEGNGPLPTSTLLPPDHVPAYPRNEGQLSIIGKRSNSVAKLLWL